MSVPLKEWLGSVSWLTGLPSGWQVQSFKSVTRLSSHDNSLHDDRLLSLSTTRGIVPKQYDDENRVRSGEELRRYWRVRPGHLVVNPMWLAHGSIGASAVEGVISPDYRVYETTVAIDARYLAALLRTHEYRGLYDLFVRGNTTYDRRVSKDDFHGIPIIVPPTAQQRAIADFLDRKTAAIDALIAKKERLIELLAEKRQALITQAVTKGFNPKVPMKDSGVEWLGQIPTTWKVLPVRRILRRIEQGWSPESEDRRAEGDEWAVLKLSAVSRGRFRPEENKVLPSGVAPELRYQVRAGDLLVTRANTPLLVGDACCVESTPSRLMLPDLIYRLTLDERRALPAFVAQVLLSAPLRGQITSDARGSSMTMAKVSGGHIRSWLIPLPSTLDEQRRIVEHVRHACRHIDETCTKIETHLDKLREYRQALITAAVTGKLDLSKEAA